MPRRRVLEVREEFRSSHRASEVLQEVYAAAVPIRRQTVNRSQMEDQSDDRRPLRARLE